MTRPELPPGWAIHKRLWLTRDGVCHLASIDRAKLVAHAWAVWTRGNPEWAAYLEHIARGSGGPCGPRVTSITAVEG